MKNSFDRIQIFYFTSGMICWFFFYIDWSNWWFLESKQRDCKTFSSIGNRSRCHVTFHVKVHLIKKLQNTLLTKLDTKCSWLKCCLRALSVSIGYMHADEITSHVQFSNKHYSLLKTNDFKKTTFLLTENEKITRWLFHNLCLKIEFYDVIYCTYLNRADMMSIGWKPP